MVRFSILVVVFLFFVASSYADHDADVQSICKQTDVPSFCLALLKSKPNGVGGDLKSLAQYTLDVLHTNTSNTLTLITKLIAQSGSDPKKQNHYKDCLAYFGVEYKGVLGYVLDSLKRFKHSDFNQVSVDMVYLKFHVDDCISGDPSDTSLLPKYASFVRNTAETTLVMTNMLVGS
jgi:pectinesterase inhibitor-like protein